MEERDTYVENFWNHKNYGAADNVDDTEMDTEALNQLQSEITRALNKNMEEKASLRREMLDDLHSLDLGDLDLESSQNDIGEEETVQDPDLEHYDFDQYTEDLKTKKETKTRKNRKNKKNEKHNHIHITIKNIEKVVINYG